MNLTLLGFQFSVGFISFQELSVSLKKFSIKLGKINSEKGRNICRSRKCRVSAR